MSDRTPQVIVIGGANGAGKSTAARGVLRDLLLLGEFVNADTIAAGLAGFAPERTAFAAGRIMLERIHKLGAARADFAFETTMASRTFAPWLRGLREGGYDINIVFLWLNSPALAIRRVNRRVREGGHDVPRATIRRRYHRGTVNFLRFYLPIATRWRAYDNSANGVSGLIAQGGDGVPTIIAQPAAWRRIMKESERGEAPEQTGQEPKHL